MGSAQIIAAIADIELPRNEWNDLMPLLMKNAQVENVNLKKSALQTIGYICETIVSYCDSLFKASPCKQNPEVLTGQANAILTAVAHGARKDEPKYGLSPLYVS